MALDEGLSSFIGRLYEAVHDPVAWRGIIGELLQLTGSRMAFITTVDVQHREYSRAMFYGKEDSNFARGMEEYQEEFYLTDPSLIWASQHPNAGMCETEAILPKNDYLKHPYIVWQNSRMATTHWRVLYTSPVDDLTFALSLHPPAEEGPPSRDSRALHRMIFEHMERAFRLAARPPRFMKDSEPVVVLDTVGRVLTMSSRAEALLNENDGLCVSSRRLRALAEPLSKHLQSLIHSAIELGSIAGAGGGLRIPRPSGKPDWMLLVTPHPRFLDHLPLATAAAMVRIIEPTAGEKLSAHHADLFGLTMRELQVAEALLSGHSIETLSSALNMSRNTARVHLQSLFQKTRTNRQPDLVHLLADVARR